MNQDDLQNLTMETPIEDVTDNAPRCPNCDSTYSRGDLECNRCGIVFAKFNRIAGTGEHAAAARAAPAVHGARRRTEAKSGKMTAVVFGLVFGVLIAICGAYVYIEYLEARLAADKFDQSLDRFCEDDISDPHEQKFEEDEEPFRTGKLLVVSPERKVTMLIAGTNTTATMTEPAAIHPVWFMLDRKLRAASPGDVDTLIRVTKELGKTHRYGSLKTKIVTTHKIHLDFYDWPNRTYIGNQVFSPGEGSSFMTEEDYEAMANATSNETISEFLESIPVLEE